jgi:hypothetical protein
MAFKQYALVIGPAPAQRLSNVYGDGVGVVNPRNDIPYRQLILAADPSNANPLYVGDSDVTAPDNAAFVLQPGVASVATMVIGPFATGAVKLSDFWVVGVTGTPRLLVSGVPF